MIPYLSVILFDSHGTECDGFTGPAAEAAAFASRFMILNGTDPDEDGAAAQPGRVEFFPVTPPTNAVPGLTVKDVLRAWPGNENSDDDTIAWTLNCKEALAIGVSEGRDIDFETIMLKNEAILDLGDACEFGDDREAEDQRDALRAEVTALCKGENPLP